MTRQCLRRSIWSDISGRSKEMKENSGGLYFVQVKRPGEVRKDILQTLRDVVEALRRFEKFKRIRHEKSLNIQKLRSLLKDSNKMFGNLKLKLPKTSLKAVTVNEVLPKHGKPAHKENGKSKEKIDKELKKDKDPKREFTELERLEAQLSAIESKLKDLE